MIRSKSDWILTHLERMSQQHRLITEDAVYFLGNPHVLKIDPIEKGNQNYFIEKEDFILRIKDPTRVKLYLDHFLKIATKNYIQFILPRWICKTGLNPEQVTYRKMKKWGACTKKGKIIFNSYLICLPPDLIEYIVCHELVHLKHFDHSRNFHQAVASFLPEVKKLEKELKMYVR